MKILERKKTDALQLNCIFECVWGWGVGGGGRADGVVAYYMGGGGGALI